MKKTPGKPAQTPDPSDALYALPLDAFTAARNALATTLKKEGKTEEAERVRALGRPSVSAWAVNQLYWKERPAFDVLMAAGERFRVAQQAQLAGQPADLLAALDARRDAVGTLLKAAARLLHAAGHSPTPDMLRRVTTTLEALATYGQEAAGLRLGRLMADVAPPGFEVLAALVPRVAGLTVPGHGTKRVLAFADRPSPAQRRAAQRDGQAKAREQAARRQQAQRALAAAQRETRRMRLAAAKARATMKEAGAKAAALERVAARVAAKAERETARAEAARREARRAAEAAEAVVQALQDAEQTVTRLRATLDES